LRDLRPQTRAGGSRPLVSHPDDIRCIFKIVPTLDLDQDEIVAVSRELIAETGLDGFSMRKLAAALGVNPMTIYLRFENKDALLDAVATASLADFQAPTSNGPWATQVVDLAVELRRHLVADRETLRLLGDGDRLTSGLLGAVDRGLALMGQICDGPAETVKAFRVLFWHVVGSALVAGTVSTLPGTQGGLSEAFAAEGADYPGLGRYAEHFGPVDPEELFAYTTHLLVNRLGADAGSLPEEALS